MIVDDARGTFSLKMANVTRSGRKLSKTRHNASGSTNSDTSGLRRSARETPSKKQTPSSTRKSQRIEKRTPPTPPIKKTSSGSRKSDKTSNLLDTNIKKDKRDNNGKYTTVIANKDGEKEPRPVRIVIGKKRLDARTYRESLLKPQAKKIQESDLSDKLNGTSQGYSDHTGASTSEGIARNGEEVGGEDAGEGSDRAGEGPSSVLRELEAGTSKNIGEIELSHSSRKRKIHSDEFHESNHGDTLPVSKRSYNSLQSSLGVSKEAVSDAEKVQVGCSARENSQKVSTGSTSEGRSISGDQCLEKGYTAGPSKRKRKSEELDSDASMTATNEEIYSSVDPVTSPPSESKTGSFLERCDVCSKRQRFEVDSKKCNICSCNNGKNRHSCNNSSLEEVREQAVTFPNPEKGGMPIHCVLKDINIGEVVHVHGSELLAEAERNSVHDQTDVHSTVAISPLEEDEGELIPRACVDTETEYDHNACVVCKLGGKLLCCDGKGCKRNYHLYCLDPPIKVVPHGVWHCFLCIKRKIQFGVHSVSPGVEFICDVREDEVLDCEGIQKQKQYLVKYKGLAHVHNRWFPEHQLFLEAPSLVTRLKKNQVLKWKSEWTKPQRLVQKRPLMPPNQQDVNSSDRQYEWLVKWSGLGYEHATWELENAPFLSTPEARTLITDYETRLEKAILASNSSREKLMEGKKLSSFRLSELPSKTVSGLDNDHQNFVNKLYAFWHNNQNAVIVEDQERILKVVLFILSMQSDACRPFLIISTSCAISAWEAEFRRLTPSVNLVVYSGNKDVRESIRALEFYEDGGCVMLQVLLSPIDAIIEDLEALELIGWEVIIVDECQRSRVSRHFEQIKKLTYGFRLLLLSGPIKESIAEYLNILSFIESGGDRNGDVSPKVDSAGTISKLKERFTRFVLCERTSESSKFVEYWVPVRLSDVQLEQYCATLLSNSISLCSYSKNDPVGALRDVLISVRKSCDHPYLVDQSLQKLLTKDLPEGQILDVGVNASGKLQVLDKILSEIKKRGLRVLILFQSIGGSGRNCIGDILDDFLRQRFGPDSYERVDSVLVTSKKQAALNMFNNKERGRFVFLIENRACLPSIKLSSVDMAILFDSDWNPLNDLRALQKITIDSQFEQLKVFRLYSSFTVEEKVLSLAKQDMTLDSNIQNINPSTSHTLLLWGAYFLFQKLDEFHSGCTSSSGSNILSEQSFLNDVVQELLSQLPNNAEINETKNCKNVLKVQQSGASYCKDITLLGEKEINPRNEELPHKIWTNLLDGKYPRWKYASEPSQRIRRKVQYFDELPKKPQENDEVVKKRKKVVCSTIDPNTLKGCVDSKRKLASMDDEAAPGTPICNGSSNLVASTTITNSVNHTVSDQPEMRLVESNERRNLRDSQKNLHLSLKPVLSKLCEILQLPEDVRSVVGKFLEYIMNNHNVSREPVTIFQAFQISLCWSAASLLKFKISHTKSLSLAKQHLNFQCKEEETDLIYSKMRTLKKMFSHQAKSVEHISLEDYSPRVKEKHHLHLRASQLALSAQQELEEGEIRESPKGHKRSVQLDSSKQKQPADSENASGSSKSGSFKSIKEVERTHNQRMKLLYQKQMEEFEKFNKSREKEKEDLEKKHKLESVLIRSLHNSQLPVRLEKLKMVDQEFAKKKEELNIRMVAQKKKT